MRSARRTKSILSCAFALAVIAPAHVHATAPGAPASAPCALIDRASALGSSCLDASGSLANGADLVTSGGAIGRQADESKAAATAGLPCAVPAVGDGCEAWWAEFGGADAAIDRPLGGVAVDPTYGRVFEAGSTWDKQCATVAATCAGVVTVAYAPDGVQLWTARYDGPNGDLAQAWDVTADPAGERVYVAAIGDFDGQHGVGTVLAYDAATGGESWSRGFGQLDGYTSFTSLTTSPRGDEVYVTGREEPQGKSRNIVTVALDAASGQTLWENHRTAEGEPWQVVASPAGDKVFVTGYTNSGGTAKDDIETIAYAAVAGADGSEPGAELWSAKVSLDGWDDPWGGIAVSPSGDSVYVTGRTDSVVVEGGFTRWVTVAYDGATGYERWRAFRGGRGSWIPSGISVSPDGSRTYVVGHGHSDFDEAAQCVPTCGFHEGWVSAISTYDSATGALVWEKSRLTQALDSGAFEVVPSADGATVYAAVDDYPSGTKATYVVSTVALSAATGEEQWVARSRVPATVWDSMWASPNKHMVLDPGSGHLIVSASRSTDTLAAFELFAYDTAAGSV